jgi:hypothetical protein
MSPLDAADFSPIRVSTSTLPPHERGPFWREVLAPQIVRCEVELVPDVPFEATAELRALRA